MTPWEDVVAEYARIDDSMTIMCEDSSTTQTVDLFLLPVPAYLTGGPYLVILKQMLQSRFFSMISIRLVVKALLCNCPCV
jgi:hypothetical protein